MGAQLTGLTLAGAKIAHVHLN